MEPQHAEFVRALQHSVRLAVEEAEHVVARSRALANTRRVLGDEQLLVRRCAWCRRFSVGQEWMAEEGLPGFVHGSATEQATHTICPECETRLVQEGKSHARNGA